MLNIKESEKKKQNTKVQFDIQGYILSEWKSDETTEKGVHAPIIHRLCHLNFSR